MPFLKACKDFLFGNKSGSSKRESTPLNRRSPSLETLEERRVLATFFVDGPGGSGSGGSDSNDGLSTATPFATIQKAADVAMPGDLVLIRGGTYREEVVFPRSGTPGNPITFEANGSENVIVTATDRLTGFTQTPQTNDNGNVYVATLSGDASNSLLSRHELTVFVNGEVVQEAKSANNADYLRTATWPKLDSSTGNTVRDSALANIPNLTGGFIRVLTSDFTITNRRITAHNTSNGTLTLSSGVGDGAAGRAYLVHDKQELVDSPGEWHFNEETNQLFLWAPQGGDPDNLTVEVKRRGEVFDTDGNDYLRFRKMTLTGGDFKLAQNDPFSGNQSDNLLIDEVRIVAPDRNFGPEFGTTRTSVNLAGNNNVVRNSEFAHVWSAGLRIRGANNRVFNNLFRDSAFNGGGTGGIAFTDSSSENLISHNTFVDMGRAAILGGGTRNLIQNNDFSRIGLMTFDVGAIYNFNADLGGTVIRENSFHNITGKLNTGLYVDNFVTNVVAHNNVFYDIPAFGGKINLPGAFINYYNNTIFDSGRVDAFAPSNAGKNVYGSRFYNNIYTTIDSELSSSGDPLDLQNNLSTSGSGNFLGAASGDFRLTSGSAAVDAGRAIPGITDGFSGSAPDIGAYELGSSRFITGHDFANPPNPVYDLDTDIFGSNRVENSSFENGLGGYTLGGTPELFNANASNFRDSALGRYGRRAVKLEGGDSVSKTITGLQPNTSYVFSAWARNVREIIQAEDTTSASSLPTTNYRGETAIGQLLNNNVVALGSINFGPATPFAKLQLLMSQTSGGDSVEVRLGSPSGTLVDTVSIPSNLGVWTEVDADVSTVSGNQSVFLVFKGGGNIGLLDSVRFAEAGGTDRVVLTASGYDGGQTESVTTGGIRFNDSAPEVVFTTGPGSTSVTVSASIPAGSPTTGFVDLLSVTEAGGGLELPVTVDTSRTQYNYDLGPTDSPLFTGQTNGVSYERVSEFTTGDISFTSNSSSPVESRDRGTSTGANAINQDHIRLTSDATFRHKLASGNYDVIVTVGDATETTNPIRFTGEGSTTLTTNNQLAGTFTTYTLQDVAVTDGELTLDIENLGFSANLTRVIVRRDGNAPPAGQQPFGGTARTLTDRVEAEDYDTGGQGVAYNDTNAANNGGAYRPNEGVDVEPTTDAGGGFNIGWAANNEWTEYTVNIPAGTYRIDVRAAASPANPGDVRFDLDGTNLGTVSIDGTGGWQNWETFSLDNITVPATSNGVLRMTNVGSGFNINWFQFVPVATAPSITSTIQAEDFNTGGQGVAYNDTTTANLGGQYRPSEAVDIENTTDAGGGFNVGWIAGGEWLEYTVDAPAGTYDIEVRGASNSGNPGDVQFSLNGQNLGGVVPINGTGGWQNWETFTLSGVTVPATTNGTLRMTAVGGGFNVNWFRFVPSTPSVFRYDFGTDTSPVQSTYTRVSPSTTSSEFSWTGGSLDARDRGAGSGANALNRDFVFASGSRTFNQTVSNGVWRVTANMGDANSLHDNMGVRAEGQLISNNVDSPANQYSYVDAGGASSTPTSFEVTVTDGQLNLEFFDNGGSDPNWVLNRLVLQRIGSPLQAAAGAPVDPSGEAITASDLGDLADNAIAYWVSRGAAAASFADVNFVVTDLGSNLLGLRSGNTIYLDDDAAGHGWYVDDDPTSDEEFAGMDLFSTLAHELGHVIGHDDLYGESDADDLMYGYLEAGERTASLDEALGTWTP